MTLGIGKVQLIDDTGTVQTAQVKLSASETRDATPMAKQFGFDSSPPPGSDVIFGALSGQRTKVFALATNHQPSRLKNLPSGGSRQYDQGGRQVLLDNSGLIQAFAPGEVLHRLMTEIAMAVYNAHTHPAPNGTTGVPNQQMTTADLTTAFRAGT
jgi:phage gp45-like